MSSIALTTFLPRILPKRPYVPFQHRKTLTQMTTSTASALVTPSFLNSTPGTILDATWYKPSQSISTTSAHAEYLAAHIPGAMYFDIDAPGLAAESSLKHTLSEQLEFEQTVRRLGVCNSKPVVVYSTNGFIASARAWWMFKTSGKSDVYVLNGGLRAWEKAGGELRSGEEPVPQQGDFEGARNWELYRDMPQMLHRIANGGVILDARSQERFEATTPEPRKGMLRGHMPGAISLPHGMLVDEDGYMKPKEELKDVFAKRGLTEQKLAAGMDVSCTCGSGVTAAIISLALYELGFQSAVYDGSWAEYGSHTENPVES